MNQCSQPSWSKLNTAAMLHDVFSVTKTHYVLAKSPIISVHKPKRQNVVAFLDEEG